MFGNFQPNYNCCPNCGNSHNIQKISAIVNNSSYSGNTVGGSIGGSMYFSDGEHIGNSLNGSINRSSSFTQSSLAQQLTPPPKPAWSGCSIFVLSIFEIVAFFLVSMFLWFIASLFAIPSEDPMTEEIISLIALILMIGGPLLCIFLNIRKKIKINKYSPIYDNALAVWREVYYCHSCDIVFLPGTNQYANPGYKWEACHQWSNHY